jgi:hypothetical protein
MVSHTVRPLVLAAVFLAGGVVACSDTSTNPLLGNGQSVSLSFSSRPPAGVSGVMAAENVLADSMVLISGNDTLSITSVEIVLRKIELKRSGVTVNCDSTADEDACEEFTVGPQLLSLPLGTGVQTSLTVPLDSGTYSKIEYKIHKPGNDSLDRIFKAANPDFTSISIRVRGTFNRVAFTYTSPLDQEQEYTFVPPLVVDASGTATNLTIRVDVTTWFKNAGTGTLISPATANVGGANEGTVKQNIKNSFRAFRDHDRDGDERDG